MRVPLRRWLWIIGLGLVLRYLAYLSERNSWTQFWSRIDPREHVYLIAGVALFAIAFRRKLAAVHILIVLAGAGAALTLAGDAAHIAAAFAFPTAWGCAIERSVHPEDRTSAWLSFFSAAALLGALGCIGAGSWPPPVPAAVGLGLQAILGLAALKRWGDPSSHASRVVLIGVLWLAWGAAEAIWVSDLRSFVDSRGPVAGFMIGVAEALRLRRPPE